MDSSLSLDAETMRAARLSHGRHARRADHGPAGPGRRAATPEELHERASQPRRPRALPASTRSSHDLERDVLPFVARLSHPGYLAFIPGEGTWPGALGDLIASALNLDTCWWLGASGPSALELVVLDWFRQWVGYPEQAAGVLVSGGSAANLTALACAREARIGAMDENAVVYMSDQTHSSRRARGTRARLPARPGARDPDRPARRASALDAPRAARLPPTGGGPPARWSWSPTPVPPRPARSIRLRELSRDLPRARASGSTSTAPTAPSPASRERGREALAGIELADSITLDPHKWLYQPIEVGALLVRDGAVLRRGFEIYPDYLERRRGGRREVNFSDLGLQLTRTCRALKLWISLRYFGVAAFRDAIDRCLDLALHAQARDRGVDELELMSPASLGVRHLSPPSERRRRRGRRWSGSTRASQSRSSARAMSSSRLAACAAGSCSGSASSTTRRRRWRSTGRSSSRRR